MKRHHKLSQISANYTVQCNKWVYCTFSFLLTIGAFCKKKVFFIIITFVCSNFWAIRGKNFIRRNKASGICYVSVLFC